MLLLAVQRMGSLTGGVLAGLVMTVRGAPEPVLDEAIRNGIVMGWVLWGLAAWFINWGVAVALTGATLGKWICGLRVVGQHGEPLGLARAVARAVVAPLSVFPLAAGLFWAFWSPRRQAWHDLLCGTLVARRGSATLPADGQTAPQEREETLPSAAA